MNDVGIVRCQPLYVDGIGYCPIGSIGNGCGTGYAIDDCSRTGVADDLLRWTTDAVTYVVRLHVVLRGQLLGGSPVIDTGVSLRDVKLHDGKGRVATLVQDEARCSYFEVLADPCIVRMGYLDRVKGHCLIAFECCADGASTLE